MNHEYSNYCNYILCICPFWIFKYMLYFDVFKCGWVRYTTKWECLYIFNQTPRNHACSGPYRTHPEVMWSMAGSSELSVLMVLFLAVQFISSPLVCTSGAAGLVACSRNTLAPIRLCPLRHAAATTVQEIKGWERKERKGKISWLVKMEASVKCCAWKPVRPH